MAIAAIVCFVFCAFTILCYNCDVALSMSAEEKFQLKEQAREMFYHAYHAYMDNAYPADELMPLSCKGRYRDVEPSRGDVDDALGNFSLTLIDTLDTLVVLGDYDEFERAVRKVIRDVTFDNDVVVSVFETNIRVLGGLLSAHILGSYLQERLHRMSWYRGELLTMARDLGFRLVPAFNTTTGVPHPRINLRYGLKSPKLGIVRETCTACAGTMILEFAALSRLTGEPIFEEKARVAMDYLWRQRHRTSDLMGTVLNIHNGDWIRRDSGVGAGIDSYYEYCLKAYILLGDDVYLERFNKHYSAVMKYVSQGPLLIDVHMHRPHTNSRNFMDALLAFWPGLQVLKGDIKPAIETHEMLYQVMQRHNFLPEAFTVDFQVHWGQHPLRPEFVESTYFLYKATNDNYYLEVGKKVLDSLQKHARVPCGFAAVKDVRTGSHEDRMDSFVLAETLKYLYLLFANKDELTIEVDDFVFTTEAHLLPLSLARLSNATAVHSPKFANIDESTDEDFAHNCPNTYYLFPDGPNFAQSIRLPLKNLVEGVCPSTRSPHRTIYATDFQASSKDNVEMIKKLGITTAILPDGRVQLVHNADLAISKEAAEEGLVFMQEMLELNRAKDQQNERNDMPDQHFRNVYYYLPNGLGRLLLNAGSAQFGYDLNGKNPIEGKMELAQPLRACTPMQNSHTLKGKIAIVERGDCMFVEKARHIQKAGAIAGIVLDNFPGTNSKTTAMFAMSGDGKDDIYIPMVFLFSEDGATLLAVFQKHPDMVGGVCDPTKLPEDQSEKYLQEFLKTNKDQSSSSVSANCVPKSSDIDNSLPQFFGEEEFDVERRMLLLTGELNSLFRLQADLEKVLECGSHAQKDNAAWLINLLFSEDIKKKCEILAKQVMMRCSPDEKDHVVQKLLADLQESAQIKPTFRSSPKKDASEPSKQGIYFSYIPCINPSASRRDFIKYLSSEKVCKLLPSATIRFYQHNIKTLFNSSAQTKDENPSLRHYTDDDDEL